MLRLLPRTLHQGSRLYATKVGSQTLDVPQPELQPHGLPAVAPAPQLAHGKLAGGVQVAAWENFGPASSLTFALNASARFETSESLGVSHFLRLFGFRGARGRTHLRLVRELDNHGANLHVHANREQIFFTAEFLRDNFANVVDVFSAYFTSPDFALHEVEEVRERVGLDLARLNADNDIRVVELLHKNAFRSGLGNSIYTPEVSLDSVDKAALEKFAAKHFVAGNLAVAGAGVDFHQLEHLVADHLKVPGGAVASAPSKYHGGEMSLGRLDETNRVGVAFETGGAGKGYFAAAVLQKILGGSSSAVSYGGSPSLLGKAAGGAGSVESFHFAYSDAGLLGFLAKSHEHGVAGLLEKSLAQLKAVASSVSEGDLARGKSAAKFEHADAWSGRSHVSEALGRQLLTAGKVYSTADFLAGVDKVTAEDVQKLAAKLAQSKVTLVAASDDL